MKTSRLNIAYLHLSFWILLIIVISDSISAQENKTSWLDNIGEKLEYIYPGTDMLKTLLGSVRPLVCLYNQNRLVETSPFKIDQDRNNFTSKVHNNLWECHVSSDRVPKQNDAIDLIFSFRLKSGKSNSTGIAVAFDFYSWSKENYLLVPAAAYNGNRFRSLSVDYPPIFTDPADYSPDVPLTITDVPRLNIDDGLSKMELTTGDASTPAVGFFDPLRKKGFLLLTEQGTKLGNSGIIIEESGDRKKATIVISAPAVREFRAGGTRLAASDDKGIDWKSGDKVTLNFRLMVFEANNLQDFFDRFFIERKYLTEPTQYTHRIPFSQALEMEEMHQNNELWFEAGSYYKCGNGTSPYEHLQIGWAGGLMHTHPFFMCGKKQSRSRSLTTIETAITRAMGKTGFFYGIYKNGKVYGDTHRDMEIKPRIAMVRKNADALYFLLKQFMLLKEKQQHHLIKPEWEAAVKKLAQAFVKLWNEYGQFGQLLNVETGKLEVGGSTAGASVPAALALASDYFDEPDFLVVARASAEKYYEQDVKSGYTTGGPGEILQCPDSESAFAMLESFIILYEITGDKTWITKAENMAKICATWVVSYDYIFPEESRLAQCNARSTGAVWASVQNKHAAPGICTASGDCLLKLYRATGNEKYLELLKDIAHNILEFMSTENRPVGNNINGYTNERVNMSDWEGKGKVGNFCGCANGNVDCRSMIWCETAIMLTAIEVPGIYVQPDNGLFYCFDHIDVETVKKDSTGITLKVFNPTEYPAKVTVLAEPSTRIGKALGWNIFLHMPKVMLNSKETKIVRISINGDLIKESNKN